MKNSNLPLTVKEIIQIHGTFQLKVEQVHEIYVPMYVTDT